MTTKRLFSALILLASSAALAQMPPQAEPKPFGVVSVTSGTGPTPAYAEYPAAMPGQIIYRPAKLPKGKLPILLWGNGGCADNILDAAVFLGEVSS